MKNPIDLKKLFGTPNPAQRLAGLNLRPDLASAAVKMVSDERSDLQIVRLGTELDDAESVIVVVEGIHGGELGFLALTTERVLFRAHDAGYGDVVTVPLAEISQVLDRARGMYGRVVLELPERTLQIEKIRGIQAAEFAQALRRQLAGPGTESQRDPMQQLQELRELRSNGGISEADYQAAKIRLLDDL